MKQTLFRIKFKIQCDFNGIISYVNGHTSVLAFSEEEAEKKVKEGLRFNYFHTCAIEKLQ